MIRLSEIQSLKKGKEEYNSFFFRVIEFFNRDLQFSRKKLSDKKKQQYFSQLEVLIHSGIDIGSALKILNEISFGKKNELVFEEIHKQVISGSSISKALLQTGCFSNYEIFSIQIGEETGRLEKVLKEISNYYTKRIKQHRSIINALSYPILVLCVAIGAIVFMLNVVVPMFSEVFKRFGGDLPLLTRVIIGLSSLISHAFPFLVIILAAAIIVITINKKTDLYKKYSAIILMAIPIVGPILRKVYISRFCSSLSLLLESKVPVIKALKLVHEMIEFYPIASTIPDIEKEILNGRSLWKSMSAHTIYEYKMIALIKIAEEVNKLDEMFNTIADQYADETEYQITILNSLLEPILIIFLGLVVGIILVAMYMPLFQLGNNIN
jgi:type IV pilus assembly protein PilC